MVEVKTIEEVAKTNETVATMLESIKAGMDKDFTTEAAIIIMADSIEMLEAANAGHFEDFNKMIRIATRYTMSLPREGREKMMAELQGVLQERLVSTAKKLGVAKSELAKLGD